MALGRRPAHPAVGPKPAAVLAVAAAAFLTGGCSRSPGLVVPDEEIPGTEYRIGPEDVLEVSVWREDAIASTVPVRPDGRITLPLAGEVEAAGLTPGELEARITERLWPYVQEDAPVTVTVKEVNHLRFYVLGEVAHPGAYPMRGGRIGLLQALALAGGLSEFADRSRILVLRRGKEGGDGTGQRFLVDYDRLVEEGRADVPILPGDTVVVP